MLALTSPVETWLHRLPAGLKLGLLVVATILLIRIESAALLAGMLAGLFLAYGLFGLEFLRYGMKLLRPLLPFAVVVAAWHIWIDEPLGGLVIILRIIIVVAIANLVTMTTRLTDMIAVVERLTPTIGWLGLRPRKLALAMALAIRFVPVLSQKLEQIDMAWRARSSGRARWRILVPAVLAVFDDATHVADALRARGGADPMK